jgi:hypothetical protein
VFGDDGHVAGRDEQLLELHRVGGGVVGLRGSQPFQQRDEGGACQVERAFATAGEEPIFDHPVVGQESAHGRRR